MFDLAAQFRDTKAQLEETREELRQLREALAPKLELGLKFGLTRTESAILGVLMAREVAAHSQILTVVYGGRAGDVPNSKIIDVFVHKMRPKLRMFGAEIETVWGRGYAISNADKKTLLRAPSIVVFPRRPGPKPGRMAAPQVH